MSIICFMYISTILILKSSFVNSDGTKKKLTLENQTAKMKEEFYG